MLPMHQVGAIVTMEDLSALAARLAASVGDVRGCLIVSRDGLVMGLTPRTEWRS